MLYRKVTDYKSAPAGGFYFVIQNQVVNFEELSLKDHTAFPTRGAALSSLYPGLLAFNPSGE